MKKINILMISFLLISISSFSQKWVQQNSPTGINLNDIHFINQHVGFCTGSLGLILTTQNGGLSWQGVNSGTYNELGQIVFPNDSVGYISGDKATLLKSTNRGKTWTGIGLGGSRKTGGLYFINENLGFWALGDATYSNSSILRTLNGGTGWDTVYSTTKWITRINFTNDTTGYATLSDGSILKTTNQGSSWTLSNVAPNYYLSDITFTDAQTGFMGGGSFYGGLMLKTTDGGTSWDSIKTTNPVGRILFVTPDKGYAICFDVNGYYAELLKTTDGGNSWNPEAIPGNGVQGLYFFDEFLGYGVGRGGDIIKWSGTYVIQGVALANASPVSSGYVKLFEYSRFKKSTLIDSIPIGANGTFRFDELISGIYNIYVVADPVLYPGATGTYYGNQDYWNNATTLDLFVQDTLNLLVNVIIYTDVPNGVAFITGTVKSMDGTRTTTGPIKDVDVTLKKVPGGEAKKAETDELGNYSFDSITAGTYWVKIDIPGLPMDSFKRVEFTVADTVVKGIDFGIDSTGIHLLDFSSTKEIVVANHIRFYPNPVIDFVKIILNNAIYSELQITDLTGRVVMHQNIEGQNQLTIDLSTLKDQIYLLTLRNEKEQYSFRILKK